MAAPSVLSGSSQHRKIGRNFGRKSGAAADGGSRFMEKSGSETRGDKRQGRRAPGGPDIVGKVRRKWRPNQDQKLFEGSAKEGQGFALWRKNKVQSDYKKLQRKQQKKANTKEVSYGDHYPEHLKHLYLAEEERLESEKKRRKPANESVDGETEVIPKKRFKKTSNQKAKEEYERVQLKRAKKREEAELNRRKREEALKLHNQKRMETYKVLCLKTKKGQPNFNVQMDYLLKKIQSKS